MCDDHTVADNEALLRSEDGLQPLSRRRFAAITATTALSMLLPRAANALGVSEQEVTVTTPDGIADCYFVHPATGKHAGVVIWPDVLGLRPAFRMMGKRLAESGYCVLVVNPYYRSAKAPVVPEGASFQDPAIRGAVMPLARQLSAQTHTTDAKAFVQYLDASAAVDTSRKIGTMGYCMGGPITFRTAAAVPDRVGAAASFHGGGLVTDAADSPHLLIPKMSAWYLVAIAENDHEREPQSKQVLQQTFTKAGLPAEVEVYDGAMHGWCPPDSRMYHQAQAEHAWERLLALFKTALA